MAVTAIKGDSSLRIRFDLGKDDVTGRTKVKSRTYGNVNPAATNDDVHAVGLVLASLQSETVLEYCKVDYTILSQ